MKIEQFIIHSFVSFGGWFEPLFFFFCRISFAFLGILPTLHSIPISFGLLHFELIPFSADKLYYDDCFFFLLLRCALDLKSNLTSSSHNRFDFFFLVLMIVFLPPSPCLNYVTLSKIFVCTTNVKMCI